MGGEHQPHEEAGLGCRTAENDHHQVQWTQFTFTDQFPVLVEVVVMCLMRALAVLLHQRHGPPEFPRLHLPHEQLDREADEAEGGARPRARHRPLQQSNASLPATPSR